MGVAVRGTWTGAVGVGGEHTPVGLGVGVGGQGRLSQRGKESEAGR